MDYKEKYEMALEGIQEILGSGEDSIKMSRLQLRLQGIFPELKESEDERIRKAIHIYLDWLDGRKDYAPRGEYTIRDMIAWVEKQGEHANFRNKIEIGDKVTRNEDGVLVNLSQLNRVAKKQGKQETLCDKCRKEQPSHSCQDITALGRCAVEHKQKPAEFDDANAKRMFIKALERVEEQNNKGYKLTDCDKNSWWEDFKTYCGYIEIQKPAWSEEDEKMFEHIIAKATLHFSSINYLDEEEINFLKSLKDRYTWKPSDEQMDALHYVTNFDYGGHKATLVSLYEQLKKLREE